MTSSVPTNFSGTRWFGLDFGTTNSTFAFFDGTSTQALNLDPDSSNPKTLRSLLYVNPQNETAIGQAAIDRYLWDVKNIPSQPPKLVFTGRYIKTIESADSKGVGKVTMSPEIIEVDQSGRGRLLQSLKSVLSSNVFKGTRIFETFYSVEDLLKLLVLEIKKRSDSILGQDVDSLVIGRPVRFVGNGSETTALNRLHQIATKAGYKNVEFEYEPVGAALNFGINLKDKKTVLVFDFGGGTLDVCIMTFPDKKVISIAGLPLGGDLINSKIIEHKLHPFFGSDVKISGHLPMPRHFYTYLSDWYRLTQLKNIRDLNNLESLTLRANNPIPLENFRSLIVNDYAYSFFDAVNQAKINLSSHDSTQIRFDTKEFAIDQQITKLEFEKFISPQVYDAKSCIKEALIKANLSEGDIDDVIITGGSSKIPIFMDLLITIFGQEKLKVADHFTAVAKGLSIRAQQLFDKSNQI